MKQQVHYSSEFSIYKFAFKKFNSRNISFNQSHLLQLIIIEATIYSSKHLTTPDPSSHVLIIKLLTLKHTQVCMLYIKNDALVLSTFPLSRRFSKKRKMTWVCLVIIIHQTSFTFLFISAFVRT